MLAVLFLRVASSSAKFIVQTACAELISSKHSTVETVLGTHRATSLADNYSNSKSPPHQSNNMDQSDWRSSQLCLLKKKKTNWLLWVLVTMTSSPGLYPEDNGRGHYFREKHVFPLLPAYRIYSNKHLGGK